MSFLDEAYNPKKWFQKKIVKPLNPLFYSESKIIQL